MKLKQFLHDGLIEARRQLFGIPTRKPRTYKYILTLSEPMNTSQIIKELIQTRIYQHFLSIEDISRSRYGYSIKYIITRKREK